MSSNKKGPKKSAGNGGGGSTVVGAARFGVGMRAGARDTEPLIRLDDPGYVAAQWTDGQLMQALESIPESQRTEAQINLERIAEFCKKLMKAAERIEQRDVEALKILSREDEVKALRKAQPRRRTEQRAGERDTRDASPTDQGQAELDAAFSNRRASVEEELRIRGQAFDEDCAKRLAAIETAGKASVADQKKKLDDRETALDARQAVLEQAEADRKSADDTMSARRRRLDRQEESLESARLEALEAARQIAQAEIDAERQRRQNAEAMARRASDECTKAISELAQFDELKRVLGGRKPEAILVELQSLHAKCEKLRDELLARPEAAVGDVSTLKKEKEALLAALNSMQPELERTKIELSKVRVGAVERDGLEKQKIALEKTNQALTAKINQLGDTVDKLAEIGQTKTSFPELVRMDADEKLQRPPRLDEVKDLRKFTEDLRQRIASAEPGVPLYYQLQDIQLLVAGLATSQLHIFQGISGTGKTSLAKALAKAIGGHCEDIAVQAGWRDRDDLLGHYNPFDKRYAEKPCLKGLYRAQTPRFADTCNVVLLDEMNLSHPEQYFADFLSALEKNSPDERVIELYESALPNPPAMLRLGRLVSVPENVWFIGTANHDETTKGFAPRH
ncbi:MAG: AAA family ATPase [Burkholderiales bacterium]|nr:AAA family ATPase [Burkholderiales bacterium]